MQSNFNNNKPFKGALHLHTKLSHDGRLSLEQLVDFIKLNGYHFMAITEHSYDINETSITDLANRCESLSNADFVIIPGIEFRCHDEIDILGFGVIKTHDSIDPATIIRHIQDNGGVAVLAHPTVRNYPIESSWIKMLDGCELWNRQEGKYLPQARSIRTFMRFKEWNPELKAFCGLDFHRSTKFYHLTTNVHSLKNNREDLLSAIKKGDFVSKSALFDVNSAGKIGLIKLFLIYGVSSFLNLIRKLRKLFVLL